jgi:hypothetical protein
MFINMVSVLIESPVEIRQVVISDDVGVYLSTQRHYRRLIYCLYITWLHVSVVYIYIYIYKTPWA